MKFKKTRIVFSVFCGVLCLLLMGLWTRSYFHCDQFLLRVTSHTCIDCGSVPGELRIRYSNFNWPFPRNWDYITSTTQLWVKCEKIAGNSPSMLGSFRYTGDGWQFPSWFAVTITLCAAIAAYQRV